MVERVERQAFADRQIVAGFMAAGAKVDLPDVDAALAAFDVALNKDMGSPVRTDRDVLLKALGVTDG